VNPEEAGQIGHKPNRPQSNRPQVKIIEELKLSSKYSCLYLVYFRINGKTFPGTKQGRIQDFKLGGGGEALKKSAPSGGRRENFWVFRVKNHDFTPKKSYSPPPPLLYQEMFYH
jgi:hypothetical protein